MDKNKNSQDINPMKICIIGAGLSGLCAAVQLKRKLANVVEFIVYENNSEIGGTWFANKYPGCACDIQSHLYSYSFAPKPDWTKEFATQPEILEYLKNVAKKFGIYKHLRFQHEVKEVRWHEDLKKWKVRVLDKDGSVEEELFFDIVINGSGELRAPKIPEEFLQFQGPKIHSAQWDRNIELHGKRVGVIGSGATAIQLIPSIAKEVAQLFSYQRKPPWVIPSFQSTFSKPTKLAFEHIPGLMSTYRTSLFLSNEILFPAFENGKTLMSKFSVGIANNLGEFQRNRQIKNKDLREDLKPNYRFGCKRVGISNKYYPALDLPHVKVITSGIEQVLKDGIRTEDGNEEKMDMLILATGFQVHEYFAPMEVFGKNGANVLDKWKNEGPTSYLGICSFLMPNYFTLLGPGSNVNHNSSIFQAECQVNWIIKIIKNMMKTGSRRFVVKRTVEYEYMKKMEKLMLKTTYGAHECGSWFRNSKGMVTSLYPKNCISYWKHSRNVDYNKFDFE